LLFSELLVFYFYFAILHPVARTLSMLLEEPSLATTLQGVYFIFFYVLPLHVLALAGHLQEEYAIIFSGFLFQTLLLRKECFLIAVSYE
jgi:hypothetical protein